MESVAVRPEYGDLYLVKLEGAAGANTLALAPPSNHLYQIQEAWGTHDDATARNLLWQITDGVEQVNLPYSPTTIVASDYWPLYAQWAAGTYFRSLWPGTLVISQNVYVVLGASAIDPAKKLIIKALVRRYTL